jgi:CubicO group peptidase (beta-lactamase class C family)
MGTLSRIDQALSHAAEAKDVAGVVAMAATEKGELYQGAFGKRDLLKAPEMTLDTVFWIASMTKAITSVAAMQLVEQGRLALDAPLGKLLPELASPQVLEGFDAAGSPRLRAARRPITLRHLLTHTAGFTYDMWNAQVGRYMQHAGLPGIITCKNDALRTPLVFDPGDRWEYGINVDWVGKAVEAASGKSLDAYFSGHIFAPLGMNDTGFVLTPSQRSRLAAIHQRKPDGSLEPIPFEVPQEPEFFMGGGGLYGTGRDYLTLLQMLLHGGQFNGARLLREETVKLMGTNQIGELKAGVMKTAMPELSNDVDFFPGMELKWGLGFLINTQKLPTGRSAGSLAWAGLGNTYFWIDPTKRVAGVFLAHTLPFADARAVGLLAQFESGVYGALEGA